MIVFNPNKRISIEETLEHPYLSSIKENMVDPVYTGKLDFSFE
jgi:serine/threonine protein kinase